MALRQGVIKVLSQIENILFSSINKTNIDGGWKDIGIFKHFDIDALEGELLNLPTFLKLYNQEAPIPVKQVTMMSSICDILNFKQSYKTCLPNIHQMLIFYNTIPLSSATAERTFSTMRRLKTWLRSTMTASTLTNRMFAAIHKSRLDDVDTETIAREFVEKCPQRIKYFGKFK